MNSCDFNSATPHTKAEQAKQRKRQREDLFFDNATFIVASIGTVTMRHFDHPAMAVMMGVAAVLTGVHLVKTLGQQLVSQALNDPYLTSETGLKALDVHKPRNMPA